MVGLELAVGELPHRRHDGVLVVGKEPDAVDPVRVSILLDGVLALCQGVPHLVVLVRGPGDDLTVVSREGHAHHIHSVVLEPGNNEDNDY